VYDQVTCALTAKRPGSAPSPTLHGHARDFINRSN